MQDRRKLSLVGDAAGDSATSASRGRLATRRDDDDAHPDPDGRPATDVDDVARLLSPDGERIADRDLDPWVADIDAEALRGLYRDMTLVRRIDTEGVALQRQGQLGLWAPCQGQEATQVGTARAFRSR